MIKCFIPHNLVYSFLFALVSQSVIESLKMSYLYLKPKLVHHYLHNFMARRIMEGGKFIGYLWIREQKMYSEFTFGSLRLLIWSNFVAIFQIILQTYLTFYNFFLLVKGYKNVNLGGILTEITIVIFDALILTSYFTVLLGRKYVVRLFNLGMHFRFLIKWIKTTPNCIKLECQAKIFVRNMVIKFILDIVLIVISSLFMVLNYFWDPNLSNFLYIIDVPLALIGYCLISTVYYVVFAYITLIIQKMCSGLNHPNLSQITYILLLYQNILQYGRKVNKILQVMILLLLFEGLVSVVDQARY